MKTPSPPRGLATVTLLVHDYNAAIAFFTGPLAFELRDDLDMGGGKRWVVVAPTGGRGAALLLARASTPEQQAAVGRQAGGRVFLFLETDDFAGDYARMQRGGVRFREAPRDEPYGRVAVFEDVCGNAWDLIEPRVA